MKNQDPTEVEMNQNPKWYLSHKFLYSVLGILLSVVIVGSYYWWQEIKKSEPSLYTNHCEYDPKSCEGQQLSDTVNWKTYTNTDYGFEFKYPPMLRVTTVGNSVLLDHSIPYENEGGCDMAGGEKSSTLVDFNISLAIIRNPEKLPYVDGKYKAGSLQGEWAYLGAEGCGTSQYHFPSGTETLVVTRESIQALSGLSTVWKLDEILKVPGVISKEENEKIFNLILSTFRFIAPEDDIIAIPGGREYINYKYGYELSFGDGDNLISSANNGKLRIQNYSDEEDNVKLTSAQFFIEVSVEQPFQNLERFSNVKETTINTYKAYEGKDLDAVISPYGPRIIYILPKKGDHAVLFAIYTSSDTKTDSAINQIIKTFKFVE